MIRFKRRNTVWLVALGLLIAFALFAAPITPAVQVALMAIFGMAMAASMVELGPRRESIIDALQRAPIRRRVTAEAREAAERAKSQTGYYGGTDILMMDLGLIAVQSGQEGMAMRRTRNVSKDDDGVRPFVTIYVPPEDAERHSVIRFEIFDQDGQSVYVHEMKTYLREGEMNVLADHHLPLAGNRDVIGAGDWDLRISVDGNLIGMHNLMLLPSVDERRRRLSGESSFSLRDNDVIVDELPQQREEQVQGTSLGQLINSPDDSRSRYSGSRRR